MKGEKCYVFKLSSGKELHTYGKNKSEAKESALKWQENKYRNIDNEQVIL